MSNDAMCDQCYGSPHANAVRLCPLHASALALVEALERMRSQFMDALAGRSVACADETIAEADAALRQARGEK